MSVSARASRGSTPQAAIAAATRKRSARFSTRTSRRSSRPLAAHLRLGPGARLRGRTRARHPHLAIQLGRGERALVNLTYGRQRKLDQVHIATRRGSDRAPHSATADRNASWSFQDPARHTVHAVCADVQRHIARHFSRRRPLPRHKGLNFSVEFTGGTVMEVSFDHAADVERIRKSSKRRLHDFAVQTSLLA